MTTQEYILSDFRKVTAQEVAKKVGITLSGARSRLKRSLTPNIISAEPNKTTDHSLDAKVHELNNGYRGTIRELRGLTGIRENTLRQRLKISTDFNCVTRPLVFEDLNANIYIFQDGSETTAYDLLESLNLKIKQRRKRYLLSDGSYKTIEFVMKKTGVAHRTAKRRVQSSTDPEYVLAKLGARHEK